VRGESEQVEASMARISWDLCLGTMLIDSPPPLHPMNKHNVKPVLVHLRLIDNSQTWRVTPHLKMELVLQVNTEDIQWALLDVKSMQT
jgi:hypothetical protein